MKTNIRVVGPGESLTAAQEKRVKEISYDGLKDKFQLRFPGESNKVKEIIDSLFEYNLLPMGGRFVLIDNENEEVISVVLLNKTIGKQRFFKFFKRVIKIAGRIRGWEVIIGLGSMIFANRPRPQDVGEIFWACTAPEYQGQGYMTMFLEEEVIPYIKKTNCHCQEYCNCWVTLSVAIENKGAVRTYEKVGFVKVKEYTMKILGWLMGKKYERSYLMELSLKDVVVVE